MREVMPSQVVQFIDQFFPWAKNDPPQASVQPQDGPNLRGILDLAEVIPDSLLSCPPDQLAAFIHARAMIRDILETWKARGGIGGLGYVQGGKSPVSVIRAILAMCPDENPPAAHADLLFITDVQLRDSIRLDIGGANRAMANAEWKAATVLAGSAIEALLHWRLSIEPKATLDGAPRAPAYRGGKKKNLDDYVLHEYIAVAEDLGAIRGDTVIAARLAKNFRNLIHPGRAVRLQEKCSRATAQLAVGAMEAVREALS